MKKISKLSSLLEFVYFKNISRSKLNTKIDINASLRQKDQFIYLCDLVNLCERTNHIFRIKKLDREKILKMDIPVMGMVNDHHLKIRTIKILKSGKIWEMSFTGNSHPFVTRGSLVSCAPPHHTVPAFLSLHGMSLI